MYGSSYPHSLKITRTTEGTQDPDTGQYTDGTTEVIYDSGCDAQEETTFGAGIMVSESGSANAVEAELQLFLEDEEPLPDIKIGDTGTLKGRGANEQIKVIAIKHIDGSIYVNRI